MYIVSSDYETSAGPDFLIPVCQHYETFVSTDDVTVPV